MKDEAIMPANHKTARERRRNCPTVGGDGDVHLLTTNISHGQEPVTVSKPSIAPSAKLDSEDRDVAETIECPSTAIATTSATAATGATVEDTNVQSTALTSCNSQTATDKAAVCIQDAGAGSGGGTQAPTDGFCSVSKSASKPSVAGSQATSPLPSCHGSATAASGVSPTNSSTKARTPTPVDTRKRQQQGAPLQRVVYYQNRFITMPIDPAEARGCAVGVRSRPPGGAGTGGGGGDRRPDRDGSRTAGGTTGKRSEHGGRGSQVKSGGKAGGACSPETMDPNIAVMAGLGPQPVPGSTTGVAVQNQSPSPPAERRKCKTPKIFKKIAMCLQDNRMRTGDNETKEKIRSMNESQDSSNMILKKILNIIFVTTGITLFLAVVIVIIYTSIVPEPAGWHAQSEESYSSQSESKEGKPGSNPGDYGHQEEEPPKPVSEVPMSPIGDMLPLTPPYDDEWSLTSVPEPEHKVGPLEREDEDHEAVSETAPPIEEPPARELPEDMRSFPINGEDDEDYQTSYYYGYDNLPIPPIVHKENHNVPETTTPPKTEKPTTTTPAPLPFPDPDSDYDYGFGSPGDAFLRHRLSVKQRLHERHRLYKYRRRHHRRHLPRGRV